MVNERKLNRDVSSFLKGEQVVSVGIVVIHVEFGKGKILPVAAGVGVLGGPMPHFFMAFSPAP